jgi:hypothetical protein
VAPGDRGHALACRVAASATGGLHGDATSRSARARSGLRIGTATTAADGTLSVALRCAASERRCIGSLRVLVGGRPVVRGPFALHAPGGLVELPRVGAVRGLVGEAAVVHARYRNGAGAARSVGRRLLVG